jgi:hypothetical protein
MILHAVSIATIFADQAQQAQCVVKCIQSVPEPEWKWWIGALAPWIGPLLSGVVSIYVAWRVFRWQGEKDRNAWIRDQKKAEWRELFSAMMEVRKEFPQIYEEKIVGDLASRWNEIEHRIDAIEIMPFIFIRQKLIAVTFYKDWSDFKEKASKDIASMPQLIINRKYRILYDHDSSKDSQTGPEYRDPKSVYCDLLGEYERIFNSMWSHAKADLNI